MSDGGFEHGSGDNLFSGVGGQKEGQGASVHTIVLPNGESVGLSRPAIALSRWFFTLRDVASKDELSMISASFLVENLGAEIL